MRIKTNDGERDCNVTTNVLNETEKARPVQITAFQLLAMTLLQSASLLEVEKSVLCATFSFGNEPVSLPATHEVSSTPVWTNAYGRV